MWHNNVDLLAYHDLDGRSGLKLAPSIQCSCTNPLCALACSSCWLR